jgi:2,5-dihydroxypyridine 5,6-dioxygenase
MLQERIEGKWLDTFENVLRHCGLQPGDTVAILSETQSRPVNVQLAELALHRIGTKAFHVVMPTPAQQGPAPIRSTGASNALGGLAPVVSALAATTMVVDLTMEGLMHAPELPAILKGGTRVLYVSNEHPELLERVGVDESLEPRVKDAVKRMRAAKAMHVSSPAGTDLRIGLEGARVGGIWGWTAKPGTLAHWPGGLVLGFPAAGSVNGTLVLAPGDANLTFKRYVQSPIRLSIVDDYITAIEGEGLDAELMRSYIAAWAAPGSKDRAAYAVSHVGWGLNPGARWDALEFYDKRDCNGTELRAFAGNFLYSTGANEVAGRYTLGHFDLPLRHCTVMLDGQAVVEAGQLVE